MSHARALAALALVLLAGCATGGKLIRSADVVRLDVEKAKKSGAMRCAPKELALAEANLAFGTSEIEWGDATRAGDHLRVAEQSVKKALDLSKTCGPAQVTIREKRPEAPAPPPPKKVVTIEKVDSDGDGVPDLEDKCPDVPGKKEFQGCPDTDGDGIPDPDDACPTQPGPKENQGCPVAKDSDGDGIPDDIDRCPLDPEDFDGFQDDDGCPDPDNDGDGIVDKIDACPNTPGPIENRGCPVLDRDGDGIPDTEDRCPDQPGPRENGGCPDVDSDKDGIPDRLDKCPDVPGLPPDGCPKKYTLVEVKKDRIVIKQQVHFDTAKWKVLPDSFPLLNQVVQVLKDYPAMRVSVEGHTDTVGAELMNMKLSQARAEAVSTYLQSKGIAGDRLEAVGYGPTKPVASNKTAAGRAQNRRTEFRIVSME
ncbi:MAG TPA: OmpA family protein [Anaeromyxobacteraceae bacterium]|nr:OmpA family protein [Anaeromyxobacteraceae bacterium]